MCINCVLNGMMGELPKNPNPQEGRTYPKGWDLAGFRNSEPYGGRVGSESDDTLRMIYHDMQLAVAHMTMAQAFSGHPMELFNDGEYICFRPAIVKRGKAQPPAWHVMQDAVMSEEDEIKARNEMAELLAEAGIDPDEVFGEMPDPDDFK
jgi:hypothetical protein